VILVSQEHKESGEILEQRVYKAYRVTLVMLEHRGLKE